MTAVERAGWHRTLYIVFFAQLMTAVGFSSIFPFLPLYVESLGATSSLSLELLAGLVFSAQAFTMMIASPIWGTLADRYGRKLMVERAAFGGAVLLLLMAFVRSAEQLVALRAIQGLVTGTLAASNALVAATVPRERTGYAMGLLQTALGTGVAVGPLIGGAAADAFGYRAAFYLTAALLFLAGLLVMFGVREEFAPLEALAESDGGVFGQWRRILGLPGVALGYGTRFLTSLGRMMIIPIAPLFIQQLMADRAHLNTITGLVAGTASAMTTLSAVWLGRLSDRVGHRRILLPSVLLAGLTYFPQSQVANPWQLLALQALMGVALGGVIPTISALLARYSTVGQEGAVYGLDNAVEAAARALAPLAGAGIALQLGLRATFAGTGLLFLATGLLVVPRFPTPARPRRPLPG
jgi:DHA1 family multidrug resistance protein-like MFS transporter